MVIKGGFYHRPAAFGYLGTTTVMQHGHMLDMMRQCAKSVISHFVKCNFTLYKNSMLSRRNFNILLLYPNKKMCFFGGEVA